MVDTVVLPMGLQTPSALSVLSLSPPLGTPSSVQWLAASICLCTCQALVEPLRRQPYQAPVRKNFLASTIGSGFGDCTWDGSLGGTVSGWPFLQSLFHAFVSIFPSLSVLFPLLRRTEAFTLWSVFFLSFMCFVNCLLGIPRFWANIHLSVSTYHVCSFVIGLPHSE